MFYSISQYVIVVILYSILPYTIVYYRVKTQPYETIPLTPTPKKAHPGLEDGQVSSQNTESKGTEHGAQFERFRV